MSSEVGALDIRNDDIVSKGRLTPGKILLVDTLNKKILSNEEVKKQYYSKKPYSNWVDENIIPLENIKSASQNKDNFNINRDKLLQIYNYTYEDLKNTILPMCEKGEEPLSSMGVDTPLALSLIHI